MGPFLFFLFMFSPFFFLFFFCERRGQSSDEGVLSPSPPGTTEQILGFFPPLRRNQQMLRDLSFLFSSSLTSPIGRRLRNTPPFF